MDELTHFLASTTSSSLQPLDLAPPPETIIIT